MASSGRVELDNLTNECLILVRSLRSRVLKMQQHILSSLEEETPREHLKILSTLCGKANETYDQLELRAKNLPDHLIIQDKDKFEKLKNLYQEESLDSSNGEMIEALIDALNYNEGSFQMHLYLSQFQVWSKRRQSGMYKIPVSLSKFDPKTNPHMQFEGIVQTIIKELAAKKMGLSLTPLERNATSSVIEVKSGVMSEPSKGRKEFVCTQKMILIENNGIIDRCVIIAPHEEWVYMEDFGEKRIDLRYESRYLVYRRLTVHTNLHIGQNQISSITDLKGIYSVITVFSKVWQCLETKCRSCNRVLKDFLPAVAYELRSPRITYHESCRG